MSIRSTFIPVRLWRRRRSCEFVNMEAAYYMRGGVDHRMIADYEYDYHSATQAGFDAGSGKPEYVVWECVERYLDRLK